MSSAKPSARASIRFWCMAWILGAVFVFVSFANAAIAVRWRTRGISGSLVPLVGGLAGLIAFLTLPFVTLNHWWWIPLLLDLGTGYLVIATVLFAVQRALTKSAL
jgi:hypothetical protein